MLRDFMILCNDAGLCGQAWGAAVFIGYYIHSTSDCVFAGSKMK